MQLVYHHHLNSAQTATRGAMFRGLIVIVAAAMLLVSIGCTTDPQRRPASSISETMVRSVKVGMSKEAVVNVLGKPHAVITLPTLKEEVWDYRYEDITLHMIASVHYDPRGVVKYYTTIRDPAYRLR